MEFHNERRTFGAFCVLLIIPIILILISCDDVGLDEDYFPTVQGELVVSGVPPEVTDEVLLALMKGLTPKFTRTIPRRDLSFTDSTQNVEFIMEAEVDTFDALFVIWKERGTPVSVIENIVGSHCENNSLKKIVITDDNPLVENVLIDVNLKKVNRTAGVSGVIRFMGEWPENIENLGLVFADPNSLNEGLNICNLLRSMDIHLFPKAPVDSLSFEYKIAPGPTLMVVAWNRIGEPLFDTENIRLIQSSVALFEAVADSTLAGMEIITDFNGSRNLETFSN